jgi:curli biogenesis system outer membrane secretion channel CsgG
MKYIILLFFVLANSIWAQEGLSHLRKRTPTIGVLTFQDNNPIAQKTGYGSSIASMLQTHLRNETNFIVLERSDLNRVLEEQALEKNGNHPS